jgi:hypothetical protein
MGRLFARKTRTGQEVSPATPSAAKVRPGIAKPSRSLASGLQPSRVWVTVPL